MSALPPIATKNGEPVKRRRPARSRRRAAARERQAPVEGPAPPLAWPVVHSATAEVRRFPPPWSVDEQEACFIVCDANRQALAYVNFEEGLGRRAAAKLLTRNEARRIAANIAKLPGLRGPPPVASLFDHGEIEWFGGLKVGKLELGKCTTGRSAAFST